MALEKNTSIIGNSIHLTRKQKKMKYHVIHSAAQVFGLDIAEEECLANKAGLSMQWDPQFPVLFSEILQQASSYKPIYEHAQISERMFHHFKSDITPTKQSLLAIAITLGISLDEINRILPKAGYFLSDSLANDVIIKKLLTMPSLTQNPNMTVFYINYILHELELPLLMTRNK